MNTNWAKILLFSLLSFALGVILCMLMCGRCGGGACGGKSECHKETSCAHGTGYGGRCTGDSKGTCDGSCKGKCGHGSGAACCKGGGGGHHGEGPAHGIVKALEAADFQGDTTIAINGGTVNVKRDGNRTEVRVMMQDSVSITKP
ncbi:MAG: hypothetical protein JNL52_01330 [Flavobacteriales bacterium]|nr:hypothetical protein [Flavobacteriales bacterium]